MKVGDLVRIAYSGQIGKMVFAEDIDAIGVYLGQCYSQKHHEELTKVFVDGVVMEYFDECEITTIDESKGIK